MDEQKVKIICWEFKSNKKSHRNTNENLFMMKESIKTAKFETGLQRFVRNMSLRDEPRPGRSFDFDPDVFREVLHLHNLQCWQILYSMFISPFVCKALCIVINFLDPWSICLRSCFVNIKKGPEYHIYQPPPLEQDMTQGQFFSGV